ncbi:membrane protein FxsA [Oceanobacillus piezotolerans]|uniref:Membrane protein FxsA n=1 Tax=Oceanobacillus piezotolerans TaxID=2448030 RepID=A0A498D998_9BACI|nr:FxsA family protein [Oceanobacillus piezotolerans]RLL47883.1 membrane protein FxsA [Oceanobacillus piezotolerans]
MKGLLLLLLVLPATEIGVFIWVGDIIGPWWVIFLILLTGIIGISIARYQGMETWNRARREMNKGVAPKEQIMDGVCIFIGGIFLLSPGFITDTIGLFFVLPFTRKPVKRMVAKYIKRKMEKGTIIYRKW